jgi:hypothetical protein
MRFARNAEITEKNSNRGIGHPTTKYTICITAVEQMNFDDEGYSFARPTSTRVKMTNKTLARTERKGYMIALRMLDIHKTIILPAAIQASWPCQRAGLGS